MGGKLSFRDGRQIEIVECFACESYTLNPESELCVCGREFYPSTKIVPPGTRIRVRGGDGRVVLHDGRVAMTLRPSEFVDTEVPITTKRRGV